MPVAGLDGGAEGGPEGGLDTGPAGSTGSLGEAIFTAGEGVRDEY